jgi:hypothetical protein
MCVHDQPGHRCVRERWRGQAALRAGQSVRAQETACTPSGRVRLGVPARLPEARRQGLPRARTLPGSPCGRALCARCGRLSAPTTRGQGARPCPDGFRVGGTTLGDAEVGAQLSDALTARSAAGHAEASQSIWPGPAGSESVADCWVWRWRASARAMASLLRPSRSASCADVAWP